MSILKYLPDIERIFTVFGIIGTFWVSYINSHKIEQVHLSINSRMDQLLSATGKAQFAAGEKAREDKNVYEVDPTPKDSRRKEEI